MSEKENLGPKRFNRRIFFRGVAQFGAVAVMVDKLPAAAIEAVSPRNSEVLFLPGQEERLANADTIFLNFGGMSVGSAVSIAEALVPSEQEFGPVGYVRYDNSDLNIESIADGIRKITEEHGIKRLSFLGQSSGTQIASRVLDALGDDVLLDHAILAETPPSLEYTENPALANAIGFLPFVYRRSAILAAGISTAIYEDGPRDRLAAAPGLLGDQFDTLKNGEYWIEKLAERARRDNSKVSFLTLEEPEKDYITDAEGSVARSHEIFDVMNVVAIGGRQEHGVPGLNPVAFNAAVTEARVTAKRQYAA